MISIQQHGCQFFFIHCHVDHPHLLKFLCRGQLVFVTVFPESGNAWENDDGFVLLQGRQYGSHACMGYDETGLVEERVELVRRKEIDSLNILGGETALIHLRYNFLVQLWSKVVDDFDEAIEGELCTYSYEYHDW